ncbi:tRNA (cytidine(34)-2'-O)-methyltransferase [Ferruginivarius sediminum]|uniref:tRNA (cytidine(34)-2'-O)-methyltransferase n=1 Tax=Ferruginivarius sediminum TaxID=2661937 RepID=A0A369T8N0_9PROT|nr:tRNA (cytidine(34)-2'-O)-methyltransferase [Ferruginivarius sediminum]RDD61681.1 tRNA (cytidine(34)-2'-O)-methyltransferase [Ferruginivarius sediminum]
MRLALYQPDIPQNTGTILRLAACLGLAVDIIEPCGFVLSDSRLRRAGMDYLASVHMTRHASWARFRDKRSPGRLILLTTRADTSYTDFGFRADDTLLLGRESAGVPEDVHANVDACIRIPLCPGQRSLNVAIAAAMTAGEALRQTGGFARHGAPASDFEETGDS